MKYIVDVGKERLTVDLDEGRVAVEGEDVGDARMAEVPGTPVRLVTLGDSVHRVIARRDGSRGRYVLWVDGWRYDVEALDERRRAIQELSGSGSGQGGSANLNAPMPGLIVRVLVAEGDSVQAGQGLVVMEAMKMENELRATAPGVVTRIHATEGSAVDKGALLVEVGEG